MFVSQEMALRSAEGMARITGMAGSSDEMAERGEGMAGSSTATIIIHEYRAVSTSLSAGVDMVIGRYRHGYRTMRISRDT